MCCVKMMEDISINEYQGVCYNCIYKLYGLRWKGLPSVSTQMPLGWLCIFFRLIHFYKLWQNVNSINNKILYFNISPIHSRTKADLRCSIIPIWRCRRSLVGKVDCYILPKQALCNQLVCYKFNIILYCSQLIM